MRIDTTIFDNKCFWSKGKQLFRYNTIATLWLTIEAMLNVI